MGDTLRFACGCGNVFDSATDAVNCAKCGTPLSKEGMGVIYLYRMGNPLGMAVGFGVYVDGKPFGHLANTQKIGLVVPYGSHTIHCTHGMSRKGVDATLNVTPDAPVAYAKAHIKPGVFTNTIVIEQAQASDMPA